MTDDLDKLKRDAEAATPEYLIGTVVGSMLKLRPGKNHHTGEVVEQVLGALELLREAFRTRDERLQRAEAALLKAFELQRVCLDAMSARPGRFHNREGYTIRVALEEFSSARAALAEEPADAG